MSIAQLRQRGATNFEAYYQSLCALESTSPIAGILTGAKLNTLKCNASQLRPSDWHPLLTALQINKTFHTISIYKKWEDTYLGKGVPPATGMLIRYGYSHSSFCGLVYIYAVHVQISRKPLRLQSNHPHPVFHNLKFPNSNQP